MLFSRRSTDVSFLPGLQIVFLQPYDSSSDIPNHFATMIPEPGSLALTACALDLGTIEPRARHNFHAMTSSRRAFRPPHNTLDV